MSQILRLASLVLLVGTANVAQPPTPAAAPAPIVLFDGRSFDGLHLFIENNAVAPEAAWKIEDGLLRATGLGRGYARTTLAFADYRLKVEWRWPKNPGNSGVMVNLVGPDLIWPKCVEAQLATGRAGDFATFSDARSKEEIVSRNPRGVSTGRLARSGPPLEKPAGEWNTYEIVVSGDTITVFVNGTQANRMSGVMPSAGMIGFQSEGTAIDFRNMVLTPLPPAKDLYAPMPPAR